MRTIRRFRFPIIAVLLIAAGVPFFIMRHSNRTTHAAAVLLDVTFTAAVTPNRIGRGGNAWAELDSDPGSAYSWRIKAGREFASIDPKNGRVTAHRRPDLGPGAAGTVTVEAYLDSSSVPLASASMLIDDEGCSSCSGSRDSAGDIHISLASGDIAFSVGRADEGKPAGVIWLKAEEPSTALDEGDTHVASPPTVTRASAASPPHPLRSRFSGVFGCTCVHTLHTESHLKKEKKSCRARSVQHCA